MLLFAISFSQILAAGNRLYFVRKKGEWTEWNRNQKNNKYKFDRWKSTKDSLITRQFYCQLKCNWCVVVANKSTAKTHLEYETNSQPNEQSEREINLHATAY